MIQGRCCLGFNFKPITFFTLNGDVTWKEFNRYLAFEFSILSQVHHSHSTLTKFFYNLVV